MYVRGRFNAVTPYYKQHRIRGTLVDEMVYITECGLTFPAGSDTSEEPFEYGDKCDTKACFPKDETAQ